MLHRLALRVLPSLTLAVTDVQVRRRKRWVMFVPGLVAFVIYRGAKHVVPLSDPLVLLGISGVVSALTALWAYRMGRGVPFRVSWREDGAARAAWVAGWIGWVYGVQLSLLVLALLKLVVQYDFLEHPEGPAMMAIIIACTSVARDAFEIGHVQRTAREGGRVPTFPDGAGLRALLTAHPRQAFAWVSAGAGLAGLVGLVALTFGASGAHVLVQLGLASVVSATVALAAYFSGEQRPEPWRVRVASTGWLQLFRFWWWPGLAFGATYYLALAGLVIFVFSRDVSRPVLVQPLMAAVVAALMGLYGYYLGVRRHEEDRVQRLIPPSLLRCPFVMSLLSKPEAASGRMTAPDHVFTEPAQRS
ncbi:hypothetical protein [Candidatus Nitrospira bockiana]